MPKSHGKSKRYSTGGRRKEKRKRRKYEIGREMNPAKVGDKKSKEVRVRGGNEKIRILKTDKVNLTIKSKGETEKVKINEVLENPSNPHYARRDIINKGAILDTEKGKAKVTSRPGQDGVVNAILIEEDN